jgi:hypothetical protein
LQNDLTAAAAVLAYNLRIHQAGTLQAACSSYNCLQAKGILPIEESSG